MQNLSSMTLPNSVNLELAACADQVNHVLLDNPKIGLQMMDAWGKVPDGILAGQFVSLGNYDECVNISDNSPVGEIQGKYCIVEILPLQKTFAGFGACIPAACEFQPKLAIDMYCQTKDSYSQFDEGDYAFLFVFGVLAFIMFLSTLYDFYTRKYNLQQNPYYILFSLLTNGEKLFETEIAADQISCLAGIRVLSMIWIIAAHRYYMCVFLPIKNTYHALSFVHSHESIYIQGAYLGVDTFLYLGGFVLTYQCFKNRNMLALTVPTIPYFYMHRLLRLLPPMIVIYFIHITIIRRLSSGPLYPVMVELLRKPCIEHWWSYFNFMQNYAYKLDGLDTCLGHIWYINVDFQLYVFTPLVIIPTTKYLLQNERFKCYCVFIGTLLLSIIVPMFILFVSTYTYPHAHTRISPYTTGLLMGLFIVENKERVFRIGKKLQYFAWTMTIITMVFCMYYISNTQIYTHDYFNNNMFITFGRPAWCFAMSWIVFSCVSNNAKTLNKFLSNSFFIVVGRLSYSMYLLQFLVIFVTMGSTRTPIFMSFWQMLHGSVCDIVISILLSIVFVLSFESPIIALAKLLMTKNGPRFTKNN